MICPSGSLACVALMSMTGLTTPVTLARAVYGEGLPNVELHLQAGEPIAPHHHRRWEIHGQGCRGHSAAVPVIVFSAGGFWVRST